MSHSTNSNIKNTFKLTWNEYQMTLVKSLVAMLPLKPGYFPFIYSR